MIQMLFSMVPVCIVDRHADGQLTVSVSSSLTPILARCVLEASRRREE